MRQSVQTATKQSNRDSQKQMVYAFDEILWEKMNEKKIDYPKLFRGKTFDEISIQEMASNVQRDFGIDIGKIECRTDDNYFKGGKIVLSASVFKEKNIEIMLHEFAHCFCSFIFTSDRQQDHGAEFVSVLRYLFNFYEILSYDAFDDLIKKHFPKINYYFDFIEEMTPLSEEAFHLAQDAADKNDFKRNGTYFLSFNNFSRSTKESEKQIYHFINGFEKDVFFKVTLNKCGFEYKTPFSDLTFEEFKNTVLLSSVCVMDQNGAKITAEHWSGYYGFNEVCTEDFRGLTNYPILQDFGKSDAREWKLYLTQYAKELKKSGKNIIRARSYKEFELLYKQMRARYFELR